MFTWFRKSRLDPLAVSMSGVKLGDRVLIAGGSDAALIAALAGKAGLTGRTCVVDESADRSAQAARLAEREGALVESASSPYTSLPFDPESFDVVVLRDVLATMRPETRVESLRETHRVLRPGGRCLVIEMMPRGGLGALITRQTVDQHYATTGGAARALEAEGFAGVRLLAERDGLRFVEGVKRNV
jgi:ubiquinone/menaquinone biosynthesis C-methylase UbiE